MPPPMVQVIFIVWQIFSRANDTTTAMTTYMHTGSGNTLKTRFQNEIEIRKEER